MWRMFRDFRIVGILGLLFFASVIQILNATVYSAEATVSRYLTALSDGRLADAASIALPDATNPRLVPLSPSARLRPQHPEIVESTTANGITTVSATVLLGDDTVPVQFTLRRGSGWSPIHTWKFAQKPIAIVDVTVNPDGLAALNGQSAGESRTVLVPQIVSVGSATNWFTAPRSRVSVTTAGSTNPTTITFTPSAKLRTEMDAAVQKYLDRCAQSVSLVPESCPFAALTFDSVAAGPTWVLNGYPNLTIVPDGTQWSVNGVGTVNLSVSLVDFATEVTTAYSQSIPYTITGTISKLDTAHPQLVIANTVEH